jgi:hypothetical protein
MLIDIWLLQEGKPAQVDAELPPYSSETCRPEVLGAARIFSDWPNQLLRTFLYILLGIVLGLACAILVFMLLSSTLVSEPNAEHLHMATSNLTSMRACALEAMARHHAQRTVHIVVLHPHPPRMISLLDSLRSSYPNLNAHFHPDPQNYFENSPLDGFSMSGKTSGGILDLAARTLALFRHGGVSIDLDRPMLRLPPSGQYIQQGALLQFPQACHPAMQELLSQIVKGDFDGSTADEVVNRATNSICRSDDHKHSPEECLGVNVMKDGKQDNQDELLCPIVQAHQEEIPPSSTPTTSTISVTDSSSGTSSTTSESPDNAK